MTPKDLNLVLSFLQRPIRDIPCLLSLTTFSSSLPSPLWGGFLCWFLNLQVIVSCDIQARFSWGLRSLFFQGWFLTSTLIRPLFFHPCALLHDIPRRFSLTMEIFPLDVVHAFWVYLSATLFDRFEKCVPHLDIKGMPKKHIYLKTVLLLSMIYLWITLLPNRSLLQFCQKECVSKMYVFCFFSLIDSYASYIHCDAA